MVAFTYIHPSIIHDAWRRRIPFRVRMTYQEGSSDKWWELTFDPSKTLDILCNHGRRHSAGRAVPFEYDPSKAADTAWSKMEKGYVLDSRTTRLLPSETPPSPPASEEIPSVSAPRVTLPPPFESVTNVRRVFDNGQFLWHAEDAFGNLVSKLSDAGAAKLRAMLEAA
jgi:hypothetical protein